MSKEDIVKESVERAQTFLEEGGNIIRIYAVAIEEQTGKRRIISRTFSQVRSIFYFFSKNLHITLYDDTKEVKGSVASPGIVRGVVRVCESVSDIDKVQAGEILVASMTRPEYLPAMQKASTFVTNEGGYYLPCCDCCKRNEKTLYH